MFLHPWAMMVGVGLVGLPLVLHLLTKPRPVRMPLSTIRFVREAMHARRARHRLRDFLVLVLRTLAVLLVALAVARPQPDKRPLVSDAQSLAAVRIVVVDVSQSMAAWQRGVTSLERARTTAAAFLRYRPGLHANVIVAGARPQAVLTEPSQNFEALRDALAGLQVRPERCDVNRALVLAADMLRPSSSADERRRELVVISDFQRSNWANADLTCLPASTQVQLESTRVDAQLPNLALLRATWRGRASVGGTAQLELEIGNYSASARRTAVEITLGDATFHVAGECSPNRRTTLLQDIPFRQAGWHTGEVRLLDVNDALVADDVLGVVVQVHQKPQHVLVTRQRAEQRPSSSHFLECGLVPDASRGELASAGLTRMAPERLNRELLAAADLIAFDHPGKIDPAEIQWLAGLLRRGHPLLYVAAESLDASNLQQLIQAAGTELQMPVEFSPPTAGQPRKNLFLTAMRQDLAPFDVFGEDSAAVIRGLTFAGGLASHRRVDALAEDVLASYNDGTACLVLTSSGAGTLAVLNADLQQSNLSKAAAFVPLLDRLVEQLLERGASLPPAVCGEPLVARLPGDVGAAEPLRIAGPTHLTETDLGSLTDDGTGVVWRWESPVAPGVFRVQRQADTVFALNVSLAAEESPLENLPAEVLEQRLAAGRAVQYQAAGTGRDERDTLWSWLLVAAVLCLVGEITALLTFRS